MRKLCLSILMAAVLIPWSGSAAETEDVDYSKIKLDVDNFNPGARCGECHIDIYALWSQSIHSRALTDPVFQATFKDERVQKDEEVKGHCIRCHAPLAHYNDKVDLDSDLAREGVTCDFCHSIQSMDIGNTKNPFSVAWGKLKRGPLDDSVSPVHETRRSELFESGDLCGGCHEMANMNGLPIITTYSEWKEAYEKEAVRFDCQDCHMPLGAGFTVSKKHRKMKRRINLHNFPGGHSRVQLLDALTLDILEETKMFGKMKVKLGLTNTGAGHSIPTGNPLRKVVVDFNVFDSANKLIFHEEVQLSRKFEDEAGNDLDTDIGILLDAVKIRSDNRIDPGETKELVFEFMAPSQKLLVETHVIYVYENKQFPELKRREKLINFTKVINKSSTTIREVSDSSVIEE